MGCVFLEPQGKRLQIKVFIAILLVFQAGRFPCCLGNRVAFTPHVI